jgi:hypothetical protein
MQHEWAYLLVELKQVEINADLTPNVKNTLQFCRHDEGQLTPLGMSVRSKLNRITLGAPNA